MYIVHKPDSSASEKRWREFLEEMLTLPQDDLDVRRAVEAARDELDVRAGKKTRAEISARRDDRIAENMKFIRESRAREQGAKQEKK
jgi:hypothetical protein